MSQLQPDHLHAFVSLLQSAKSTLVQLQEACAAANEEPCMTMHVQHPMDACELQQVCLQHGLPSHPTMQQLVLAKSASM